MHSKSSESESVLLAKYVNTFMEFDIHTDKNKDNKAEQR